MLGRKGFGNFHEIAGLGTISLYGAYNFLEILIFGGPDCGKYVSGRQVSGIQKLGPHSRNLVARRGKFGPGRDESWNFQEIAGPSAISLRRGL